MPVSATQVESWLEAVKDPEIPVISIKELGILQSVTIKAGQVRIDIIPTYSGCPAMYAIQDDIKAVMEQHHISQFIIHVSRTPVWSTDMISEPGRQKMQAFGIAPPVAKNQDVVCPLCHSTHTTLISQYGSTACKSLYRCQDCLEPFDYFKCHAPVS